MTDRSQSSDCSPLGTPYQATHLFACDLTELDEPCQTILTAVAEVADVSPLDLPKTLYDQFNPDSLNNLFKGETTTSDRAALSGTRSAATGPQTRSPTETTSPRPDSHSTGESRGSDAGDVTDSSQSYGDAAAAIDEVMAAPHIGVSVCGYDVICNEYGDIVVYEPVADPLTDPDAEPASDTASNSDAAADTGLDEASDVEGSSEASESHDESGRRDGGGSAGA